ncbi:MAG: four helix bundle protein, partial [Fimbriiglobus sp.]
MASYRELTVWQRAMDLTVECYRITARFPKTETYGLASQQPAHAGRSPVRLNPFLPRQPHENLFQVLVPVLLPDGRDGAVL